MVLRSCVEPSSGARPASRGAGEKAEGAWGWSRESGGGWGRWAGLALPSTMILISPSSFMSALTSVLMERLLRLRTSFLYLANLYQLLRNSWGSWMSSWCLMKLSIQRMWSYWRLSSSWSQMRKLSFFSVSPWSSPRAFWKMAQSCSSMWVAFSLISLILRSILLRSSVSWFLRRSMLGSISFTFELISEQASLSLISEWLAISPLMWFPNILQLTHSASLHTEQYSSSSVVSWWRHVPNFLGLSPISTRLCLVDSLLAWQSWSHSMQKQAPSVTQQSLAGSGGFLVQFSQRGALLCCSLRVSTAYSMKQTGRIWQFLNTTYWCLNTWGFSSSLQRQIDSKPSRSGMGSLMNLPLLQQQLFPTDTRLITQLFSCLVSRIWLNPTFTIIPASPIVNPFSHTRDSLLPSVKPSASMNDSRIIPPFAFVLKADPRCVFSILQIFLTAAAEVPSDSCSLNSMLFQSSLLGSTLLYLLRKDFSSFIVVRQLLLLYDGGDGSSSRAAVDANKLQQQVIQMASNFPLLPGFAPTQEFKDHYKRVSARKQEDNRDVNKVEPTRYPLPREAAYVEPQVNNTAHLSTAHDHFNPKNAPRDSSQRYQPEWVHLDRHVLRFFGFFKEAVVERNGENERNRKVKVLFYLEDNSVSINEEKFENSGIPQGKFLKREKYVKEDGKWLTAYDLRLGQAVTIYGRSIYLYNCDDYTREFFEKAGQPQGPAEDYSNDVWTATVTNKWVPKKDAQMKEYLEKKLGGGKINSEKQFLENDRKVLKFWARFEGAPFIVHYFLADDTIEVREVALPNSGKDPFPVTFKRQKLPRSFALNQPGQTYAENFVRAEDLAVGTALEVFGRAYFLEDADQYTRDYYRGRLGVEFPASTRNGPAEPAASHIIVPPHNGIGSEEDSLGYIYRLVPKPPKKDFFKWVDQQICLRFNAVFTPSRCKPEDTNRKFILTYYLNDDSLQIYEPPAKNNGFWNGKFLERGSYKSDQGQVYQPEHLVVGQDIRINGYWFHLTECDDFTKKWYAENTLWA